MVYLTKANVFYLLKYYVQSNPKYTLKFSHTLLIKLNYIHYCSFSLIENMTQFSTFIDT